MHFWHMGSSLEDALAEPSYQGLRVDKRDEPYQSIPANERVLVTHEGTPDCSRAKRPDQKGFVWMKDVVWKFKSPGQTIFDLFGGTFGTAKACRLLPSDSRSAEGLINYLLFQNILI